MKKKVLFAATVYTHLANFHKPFIKMLLDDDYELHAMANPNEGRKQEIERLGVNCWDISFSRKPIGIKNMKAMKEINMVFKQNYFDLIHVHTPVASILVRLLAKRNRQGRVLYTAHGLHFYKNAPFKNWLMYYPIEKMIKSATDGLIVMNNEDYHNANRLGFKEGKDLFMTHGVGVDLRRYSMKNIGGREKLGFTDKDIIITCIAEFTENKNHRYLIDSFQKVRKTNSNVHLLLVGSGEKENEIKEYVNKTDIIGVNFLGFREDVPTILNATDIVALVSKREGLPKNLLEAMANGKPMIVTNVRGSKDLVKHGQNGFVVNLNDVSALTKFLNILIQNEKLRDEMGMLSRLKIKDYDIANVKRELGAIYSKYI